MITIGFYGTGNMAIAMAKGLKGLAKIYGYGKNPTKNKKFNLVGRLTKNEEELFEKSNIIILAVKPQSLKELKKISKPCCSLLAGTEIEKLKLICSNKILRIMPSISIENRKGAILRTGDSLKGFDGILKKLGTVFEVPETDFHELSLIAGSMPALISLYLSSMQNSLSTHLSEQAKQKLLVSSFEGVQINEPFEELIKRVASPGGITEQYLQMEEPLMNLVREGILRAKSRSEQLAKSP